jgi:signal transduction histidine kinase
MYREEFRVVSRTGNVRWLAGLASRFDLERGLSVVGLNLDITQRKENELALETARAELQRHATRLEELVAERTAKLEASVKSMEELLYTIAHDLRAPNRAVQGYSELLLEDYGEKLDPHARELLRRMKRAATRNDELIRDLLQLGRISNAEVPIEKVDPGRVLAESIQQLEREVDLRHARIRIAPEWPAVLGNPALLKQVFTNLISNAIKYVPQGRDPELHISASRENGRAILRFADNGVGIESDQQKRIFEAFIRLPGNREPAGTGIGLAIVRKAAERMNGRVGLDSTPGQGTCFWVELPAG